jgi:hypothetical protein
LAYRPRDAFSALLSVRPDHLVAHCPSPFARVAYHHSPHQEKA